MGKSIHNRRNNNPYLADFTQWLRDSAGDNSEQRSRLKRNLAIVREQELTPRQRQVVELYFDQQMKIPQIAAFLGVSRSTVSRTLRRAKNRIYRCLRYSL